MANELRIRSNFMSGTVLDNPLAIGALTFSSAELANFDIVDSAHHAAITLDPEGRDGEPEIVWITDHSNGSTVASILRQQENTVARQHNQGTVWAHASTKLDFESQYFTFTQTTPATVWTVSHYLQFFPSVMVVTSAGDEVLGDIHHVDNTTLTVTFGAAFAGHAYLS